MSKLKQCIQNRKPYYKPKDWLRYGFTHTCYFMILSQSMLSSHTNLFRWHNICMISMSHASIDKRTSSCRHRLGPLASSKSTWTTKFSSHRRQREKREERDRGRDEADTTNLPCTKTKPPPKTKPCQVKISFIIQNVLSAICCAREDAV